MFHINEKYLGNEKRKIIELTKKNEIRRQALRNKQHPITRELDNYFRPDFHERPWFPNGKYIVKRHYYYANPGLGYNYERDNVKQLKNILELENEKSKKKKNNEFLEYLFMEENQYIITIEFCSNCKDHEKFTSHNADLFKNYAIALQKCILLRFPFISVLLKPIETDIKKPTIIKFPKLKKKEDDERKYINDERKYINDEFKDVKIGAFEVQLCYKSNNNNHIIVLHSKLETKKWPKIENILNKIVSYMPKFMGKIILYQKETEEDEDQTQIMEETKNQNGEEGVQNLEEQGQNKNNNNNENNKNFKNELIEGLKINIYLQKNNQITEISKKSWDSILKEKDPFKRHVMNQEKVLVEKQEMFKSGTNANSVIENKKFNRSRPASAYSNRKNYSSYQNTRPSSSKNRISLCTDNDYINSGVNPMEENLILDEKISKNLKGKLIITKYTNSKGCIDIGPLPYDSYYIEVSESRQYRNIGMCLVFNKLSTKNNHYIKRYIGLYTQENSFIQLHVFETKKDEDNKEDPVHISGATVTIEEVREGNKEDYLEDKECKFEIKEKENSPGIFEQTVKPGKYLLKIKKDNYETVTKTCFLQKGLNCINIELFKERTCKLVIKVYNYEKLIMQGLHSKIQNADVVIYQNANEILEQGITDNNGELEYIVNKEEDFLTIVINKVGYFPIQRTFIRDKNMIVNECDQYYEGMSFFLVKKNFVYNTKCILILTYSNIKKNNFIDVSELNPNIEKEKYTQIINAQESDGMHSICLLYKEDSEIDNTQMQTQNNYETQNNENNQNNDNNNNYQQNQNNDTNNYQQNQNNENEEERGENIDNLNNDNNNNEEIDENYNNNENQEQNNSEKKENFDYIMNLTLEINSEELLIHNYQDKGFTMNGLERYGCQTIIYTPKNAFYINSPNYCREGYKYWNIGWIDFKNELFYQTNALIELKFERIHYLSLWLDFLQTLINNQIYKNLFEYFGFQGSALNNKDRYIYESIIKKKLIELNFCDENNNEVLQFICELFKSNNNMISYGLIKKKITSNLKNFFDNLNNESSNVSFGYNTNHTNNSNNTKGGFADTMNNQP